MSMNKILSFFKRIFKKKEGKPAYSDTYKIIAYKNGEKLFSFSSDEQNLSTLNDIMYLFNVYKDYTITYDIYKHKVKVYFVVKKDATEEKKEDK